MILGNGYNSLIEISIEDVNGIKVAKINIKKKASEPVFLISKGKDERVLYQEKCNFNKTYSKRNVKLY